jgi:oxygen-dependent protoporphyrinogen oxidase
VIAVIGGGMAGLSAAWEIVQRSTPGARVIVFEGDGRCGGKVRSGPFAEQEVDLGPDAFVARRPEAVLLCSELGLSEELVAPGARGAYVWARGRLRRLPDGLALGVPTRLGPLVRSGICSPAGLVGPARDLLRPPLGRRPAAEDSAVGPVVRHRLGAQVAARLADPLIGGIHAGTTETMSSAAVFPALLEADHRAGSLMRALRPPAPVGGPEAPVFLAPRLGMGRLVQGLTHALEERGVDIRRNTPVTEIGRQDRRWTVGDVTADGLVMAVPTPAAAGLLAPHDTSLAAGLDAVTYSSVTLITLLFAEIDVGRPLDGSGFLVPRGEGGAADPLLTACTWLSSKWPEHRRTGQVLMRVSVGRAGDIRHESLDDDELVRRCLAELGPMMGSLGSPTASLVTRWPLAFPQYTVGHRARVASMEAAAARLPVLALAGAAFHGVGIPACIGSGRRAAATVLDALAASS